MAIDKYTDFGVSPGGAGTIGDPYSDLQETESAIDGSLSDNVNVNILGTSADTGDSTWSGFTLNGNYVQILGNQDYSSSTEVSTSLGRVDTASTSDALDNVDCDLRLYDFAIKKTATGTGDDVVENNELLTIDRCVIDNSSATGTDNLSGVRASSATATNVYNSVILGDVADPEGTGSRGAVTFYNCTILGQERATRGISKVVNVIFQDNNSDLYSFSGTSNNNLTDNGSLSGSNNVTSSTLTFIDKANNDFHLAAGDTDAIDAGIGPSSDASVPSPDIGGTDTRSGTTCDIGCDERVVAAGSFIPIYIQTKQKHYVRR